MAAAGPADAAGAPGPRDHPLPARRSSPSRSPGAPPAARRGRPLGILIPIAIGLLRYLTTSFRIPAGRIELQRGLVSRHVLSTPVDRVRTVDLTSSLIQRAARADDAAGRHRHRLDQRGGEARPRRPATRPGTELCGRAAPGGTADDDLAARRRGGAPPGRRGRGRVRAVVAAVRAAHRERCRDRGRRARCSVAQFLEIDRVLGQPRPRGLRVPERPVRSPGCARPGGCARRAADVAARVGGYLVTNWAFRRDPAPTRPGRRLAPEPGPVHHPRDHARRRPGGRGHVTEPIGVRAAGGARLGAIVTGLDRSQQGSSTLVPPAPRATVDRTACAVLGVAAPSPVRWSGTAPPPSAAAGRGPWSRGAPRRRRASSLSLLGAHLAALRHLLVLPVAALLAADRARSLGHALVDRHVVARAGSVVRRRRALEVDHVIGWNFSATWFQRRAGLTTLVATTAGGGQAVPIPDIPEDLAVALAERGAAGPGQPVPRATRTSRSRSA